MRRMITSVVVSVLFGGFTVAAAQLPPDIMADAYLLQAEQAVRDGDHDRARGVIQNLLLLQAEHELVLPDEFHFRYAKAAAAASLPEQALEAVVRYLAAAGREGQHYVEALELMNTVQAESLRDGVTGAAAQLPPDIMADKYLLQAEQAIREEDYEGARAAMEKILSLQAEHDLTLPEEFHFKYAQVAALEDLPEQALEAVVKYLAAAGREGQHYVEALELMNTVQAAASCKGWNAEEYFETATLEQVTACLDTGVDLEAQNDPDGTPLHRAASRTENLAVIEALLLAGADLEAKDEYSKWTPLHEAARSNRNPAAIEALLLAGADLEARNEDGYTPLHLAAQNNENPAVVEALLAAGADRTIALYIAAQNNENPAVVQVLIDAGADPTKKVQAAQNCKQWNKEKFFRKAAVEDVIACLDAGADPMARGRWDRIRLHLAAKAAENPEVVKVLIAAGADPQAQTKGGNTPLHYAAMYNENPAIIEALLAAGADPTKRGIGGNTPLHYAAIYNENPEVAKALIAAGADVDAGNNVTPLHFAAAHSKNPEVVKVLIDAGANQMARTKKKGKTPLQLSRKGNKKVLRNAWAGLTIERQKEMRKAADYRAQARRRKVESGPGLFGVAVGVLGGTAIAAAGGGTEEAMEAGAVFAEGVITGQQPVGNSGGGFDPAVSGPVGNTGVTAGAAPNAEDFSAGGVIVSNCAREGTRACIKNRNSQPAFVRFCTPAVDGQYKPALCVSVTVRANGGFVYQGSVDHVAEIYSKACALDNTKGPKEQACYFDLP